MGGGGHIVEKYIQVLFFPSKGFYFCPAVSSDMTSWEAVSLSVVYGGGYGVLHCGGR